jgi:hypothetical protein
MGSKAHQTTRGLHFTNWKGKEVISTVSDEWKLKWNFNIANQEGMVGTSIQCLAIQHRIHV